jgi:hypothetical protein
MMKRKADSRVTQWLLKRLRTLDTPTTRDSLAEALQYAHEFVFPGARYLTIETCARQLRLAFNELERQGYPVISDGHGFRLATTPEERTKAARKLEKMGLSLLKRASIIRGLTLDGEMKQLSLEEL